MSAIFHLPVMQIWIALALDFLIGDPRRLPHPVKLIGALAAGLEAPMRRRFADDRTAGIAAALMVIGTTALTAWIVLAVAARIAPWAADAASIVMLFTTLAARDLADHGRGVLEALSRKDLAEARRRVARLVGRDTACLDEAGVIRAAVESIAENTVDGVVAPLFFAFLGGPVAAMAYKAVSTLDSTFGYRNERYLRFGWASARIDDAANYLPARIGAGLIALAALGLGEDARACLHMCRRDGRKHSSPNSGLAEAAAAGALGVRLGGPLHRHGHLERMPEMGDPLCALRPDHIARANRLMLAASLAAALVFTSARLLWRVVA